MVPPAGHGARGRARRAAAARVRRASTRSRPCTSTGSRRARHENMFRPAAFDGRPGRARGRHPLRPAAGPRRPAPARAVVGHARRAGVDAQGAVRVRVGLGPAPAHDRHLAAGRAAARAPRDADRRGVHDARYGARRAGLGARRGRGVRRLGRADRRRRAARAGRRGDDRERRAARRRGDGVPRARRPAAVVDPRPGRAGAARPPRRPARRRRGRRRGRASRRHAHRRARPVAGPGRAGHALLPLRAQRVADLRPRRELDPRRVVRRRPSSRPATTACWAPRATRT